MQEWSKGMYAKNGNCPFGPGVSSAGECGGYSGETPPEVGGIKSTLTARESWICAGMRGDEGEAKGL